jgi:hypothetical protein
VLVLVGIGPAAPDLRASRLEIVAERFAFEFDAFGQKRVGERHTFDGFEEMPVGGRK